MCVCVLGGRGGEGVVDKRACVKSMFINMQSTYKIKKSLRRKQSVKAHTCFGTPKLTSIEKTSIVVKSQLTNK